MNTEQSRQQVADLILKTPDGDDMVVCSDLSQLKDPGSCSFEVMDPDTGQRFEVTVRSEEI